MRKFFKEFGEFINKGNVIQLAIGIIIGASFQAIVKSLANDIIMPLISSMMGFNIKSGAITLVNAILNEEGEIIRDAVTLNYGVFLQTVLDFLIVALSIFVTIKIMNTIRNAYTRKKIHYLKKLKKEHPELFDEEDEAGTVLYEKMKGKYPEFFQDEIVKEEEPKEPTDHELLMSINNHLEIMNSSADVNNKAK